MMVPNFDSKADGKGRPPVIISSASPWADLRQRILLNWSGTKTLPSWSGRFWRALREPNGPSDLRLPKWSETLALKEDKKGVEQHMEHMTRLRWICHLFLYHTQNVTWWSELDLMSTVDIYLYMHMIAYDYRIIYFLYHDCCYDD